MPQIRTLAGGRYSNEDMVLKCDNGGNPMEVDIV